MVKEWTDPYNPFNSMKVLVWSEQLQALSEGKILPPVTVDTDPTTQCNFNCKWCNAERYRKKGRHTLTKEQLTSLVHIYSEWNVKSTCIAGGGEPTLNPYLSNFIRSPNYKNIESGVISNGSMITDDQIDAIVHCSRWIGFSVDSGNAETFVKVKGLSDKNIFKKVIGNIEKLCDINNKMSGKICDVAFKFLAAPVNISNIYEAAKLAKDLGCQHFHLRPACVDNLESLISQESFEFEDYVDEAQNQIAMAMELEDENFKIFGVQHKFGKHWERIIRFEKCRATPLLATFGADGYCHLCFDLRGKDQWIMCRHKDIIKFWGSEKHLRLIESIKPTSCPRCTFGAYNEIIEQVFIKDKMCRNFP